MAAPETFAVGVSIVVPVYRSTSSLIKLASRVAKVLEATTYELIFVDDGSPHETWATIQRLAAEDEHVVGIRLGRNVGQHNALLAGVRAARFAVTVTVDDDLQNPPEEIPALLGALTDDVDVVYGASDEVAQRRWRRLASGLARVIMASALGAGNAIQFSSFRAFRTRLRVGFGEDLGPAVSLDALLSWSTAHFVSVPVRHDARSDGSSNYTIRRLMRFALDTATGYSALPLQVATTLGLITAVFGLAVFVWVLGRLLISGSPVPGFPFLASLITIFAGVQLVTLGIIGEYLARMHFRVMRKPTYVIAAAVPLTEPERPPGDM